jgi:hypothetical protein
MQAAITATGMMNISTKIRKPMGGLVFPAVPPAPVETHPAMTSH